MNLDFSSAFGPPSDHSLTLGAAPLLGPRDARGQVPPPQTPVLSSPALKVPSVPSAQRWLSLDDLTHSQSRSQSSLRRPKLESSLASPAPPSRPSGLSLCPNNSHYVPPKRPPPRLPLPMSYTTCHPRCLGQECGSRPKAPVSRPQGPPPARHQAHFSSTAAFLSFHIYTYRHGSPSHLVQVGVVSYQAPRLHPRKLAPPTCLHICLSLAVRKSREGKGWGLCTRSAQTARGRLAA